MAQSALNIQALQNETLAQLSKTKNLLEHYQPKTLNNTITQLKHQQQTVQQLSLRITIVAPMKAGKSTLVNAITGYPLMPSHSMAMTSLPTEIHFNSHLEAPVLLLNENLKAQFQNSINAIQQLCQQSGLATIQHQIEAERLPHLKPLLQRIYEGFELALETHGQTAAIETLTLLNHLLRLQVCLLSPEQQQPLVGLPRVDVPLSNAAQHQWQQDSNLVIIDTPGPDEAANAGLNLPEMVKAQLEQSTAVFMILNFTVLNTQSAAEIKEEVQRVIDLRGKENLFVVVNKIDARGMGDMTTEEIQQYINAEFGIDNPQQVFETSAIKGLIANQFLQASQQFPEVELRQSLAMQQLLQKIYPEDWTEGLELPISKLVQRAEKMWTASGIGRLLDEAVMPLSEQGQHHCLRTALTVANQALEQLHHNPDKKGLASCVSTYGHVIETSISTVTPLTETTNGLNAIQEKPVVTKVTKNLSDYFHKTMDNFMRKV